MYGVFPLKWSNMSSMLKWLKKANPSFGSSDKFPAPKQPCLPKPSDAKDAIDAGAWHAANQAVLTRKRPNDSSNDVNGSPAKKSQGFRSRYFVYEPELRLRIAKSVDSIGLTSTARKFSGELGHVVSKTTVQSIRKSYLQQVAKAVDPAKVISLPSNARGRPLLLGPILDGCVRDYVEATRLAGGIVSRSIVVAAAKGIVRSKEPSLLKENGGNVELGETWAVSLLRRANYVKRKGTKAAKKSRPTSMT